MLEIKKEGVLLKKTNLRFENEAVLNPAVIRDGEFLHIFYRAVSKGNFSSIGYCKLAGPNEIIERSNTPILFPQYDYESHGIEDPRIVKIDDLFYLTYTAYDGINALGALAISKDLEHFEKKGIIVPTLSYREFSHLAEAKQTINEKYLRFNDHGRITEGKGKKVLVWDKNAIFFPRKIKGKFVFLHRIRPDIQLVCVESIEELNSDYWQNYFLHLDEHIVLTPKYQHEVS